MSVAFPRTPDSTIDVHAHAWLSELHELVSGREGFRAFTEREIRRSGPESALTSTERFTESLPKLTDPDVRIGVMDHAGVDVQVVSVVPTQYHSWADLPLAEEITRVTNEGIASHCAAQSDRLCGLGVVPLQHPEHAVEWLEHAVLECGLRGIEISSYAEDPVAGATVELSDHRLDDLWRRAEELEAVVFLHPWDCALEARLDRWYLSNSVGQLVEHAVALSHLIFGGVLDRFPGLRLIAAHGGGFLPVLSSRNDHAWQVRPESRGCRELPSSYLRRLWFDSVVNTPGALEALVAAVGADRVVLGSDHPFDMGTVDPLGLLRQTVPNAQDFAAIAGQNAARLRLLPGDVTLDRRP
ncbi:amidohydrolase family protein [Streptomyces sp. 8L]|uniref:amidohydrolase family protein n=1 Tax=Streptomyces sp. 8L TaxID=2877242 RepID=UPI001CD49275|nr:amidohydrolase family protein [Streptomyces sp. 8L]MCA1223547.1 amidohydrolase [Streptomyces sp. 8L]